MKERPVCRKCGAQHWSFIACADAEAENAAEDERAVKRVAASTVPVVLRDPPAPFNQPRLREFRQTAPGVFVRKTTTTTSRPPEAA